MSLLNMCVYICVYIYVCVCKGFPGGASGKEHTCNAGDIRDSSLTPGLGRSPGEGNVTHSSITAWRIPWTEEPGGLQSMGSQIVGQDLATEETTIYIYVSVCVCGVYFSPLSIIAKASEQVEISYFYLQYEQTSLHTFLRHKSIGFLPYRLYLCESL